MQTNETPVYDFSVNTTGCCARFNPAGWDDQVLRFEGKRFVRARTLSVAHVPLNMGRVMTRVKAHITAANADDPAHYLMMSRELSAFSAEHLVAVTRDVPGEEMCVLSGDYATKTFDGPYSETRHWFGQMQKVAQDMGHDPGAVWFFYTTCPNCAKAYARNPIVGLVELHRKK